MLRAESPILLCKLVFTNKDASTSEMYLVSNHWELSTEESKTLQETMECAGRSQIAGTKCLVDELAR
jgi:hypothetical protein